MKHPVQKLLHPFYFPSIITNFRGLKYCNPEHRINSFFVKSLLLQFRHMLSQHNCKHFNDFCIFFFWRKVVVAYT